MTRSQVSLCLLETFQSTSPQGGATGFEIFRRPFDFVGRLLEIPGKLFRTGNSGLRIAPYRDLGRGICPVYPPHERGDSLCWISTTRIRSFPVPQSPKRQRTRTRQAVGMCALPIAPLSSCRTVWQSPFVLGWNGGRTGVHRRGIPPAYAVMLPLGVCSSRLRPR